MFFSHSEILFVLFADDRYGLKEDVRQSLYDCCDEWMEAIGEHREFLGGDSPNLGDLVRRV